MKLFGRYTTCADVMLVVIEHVGCGVGGHCSRTLDVRPLSLVLRIRAIGSIRRGAGPQSIARPLARFCPLILLFGGLPSPACMASRLEREKVYMSLLQAVRVSCMPIMLGARGLAEPHQEGSSIIAHECRQPCPLLTWCLRHFESVSPHTEAR